jgi:protein TonB
MTPRQLLTLCVVGSFFFHVWLLQQTWTAKQIESDGYTVIPMDFEMAESNSSDSLALEQGIEEPSDAEDCEDAARRLKRLAVKHYLKEVHAAIERRKFLSGNGDLSKLIGNVLYSFHIRSDDSFTDIRLVRSSGDSSLDAAARRAIVAASGVTKRPKIIRGQQFTVSITVKYQYNM